MKNGNPQLVTTHPAGEGRHAVPAVPCRQAAEIFPKGMIGGNVFAVEETFDILYPHLNVGIEEFEIDGVEAEVVKFAPLFVIVTTPFSVLTRN